MKTRVIPFDLAKAKAGAKIITRNGNPVRITCYDVDARIEGFTLLVLARKNGKELPYLCRENGTARLDESEESDSDLFIEEEIKLRRMTYKELSQWLRDCPNEFREAKNNFNGVIFSVMSYRETQANTTIDDGIVVRRNYGEWEKPPLFEDELEMT